jgi:hypothetical protein
MNILFFLTSLLGELFLLCFGSTSDFYFFLYGTYLYSFIFSGYASLALMAYLSGQIIR